MYLLAIALNLFHQVMVDYLVIIKLLIPGYFGPASFSFTVRLKSQKILCFDYQTFTSSQWLAKQPVQV